ncbi:MAG: lipoate--protein ligase family protein [Verrucomicrobia bacterium]|nr:lipoate--protein ligase family protein [Verrucomicrobiota bacterium]
MSESWFLLRSGLGFAAENMAVDEALLEACGSLGRPVLRFYGWREPAATFGYSQKYAEAACWTRLRPLIRRPTGGGLVPHGADWTYSLVFPPSHPWHALKAVESYRRVHEWLRRSFERLGVETSLSPRCEAVMPGQCFVGAAQFDLLCGGRKIAGAAQRRNRFGLLVQGSIQAANLPVPRTAWETAMLEIAPTGSKKTWMKLEPPAASVRRIAELCRTKYSDPMYNQRR